MLINRLKQTSNTKTRCYHPASRVTTTFDTSPNKPKLKQWNYFFCTTCKVMELALFLDTSKENPGYSDFNASTTSRLAKKNEVYKPREMNLMKWKLWIKYDVHYYYYCLIVSAKEKKTKKFMAKARTNHWFIVDIDKERDIMLRCYVFNGLVCHF